MSVRISQPNQTLKRTPSGSGESIPSSMETVPTDCMDPYSSGDEGTADDDVWGRLFPIGPSFVALGEFV